MIWIIYCSYKTRKEMTNNYKDYTKRHIGTKGKYPAVEPLSDEEKANLKIRILLAINDKMA